MYSMMDVTVPALGVLYSLAIVVIGNFFCLNLILAAIIDAYLLAHEQEEEKREQEKDKTPELVFPDEEFADELQPVDEPSSESDKD